MRLKNEPHTFANSPTRQPNCHDWRELPTSISLSEALLYGASHYSFDTRNTKGDNTMKRLLQVFCIALSAAVLSGCVATIPVKAAKAGVKATKKTVKATTAIGGSLIPDFKKKKKKY